jgi:hypothetical protein
MRVVMCAFATAAMFAACGGSSKKTATPTAGVQSPAVAQSPAAQASTPAVSCAPPPPGPPSALQYQAPATSQTQAVLNGMQVTTGPCTDRAVFTFAGPGLPGYTIKYVPAISACGSGQPVTTAGPARIYVRLEPAVARDTNGNATVSPLSFAPNDPSIMELKSTCDFEGVVAWAIGTEERYYTVTTAPSPPSIIVEVYH